MFPSLADLPLHCPTMFPSFQCSAQVCADVQAAAQLRLDEGELDRLVQLHFGGSSGQHAGGASEGGAGGSGSRLLQLLGQACSAASEAQPHFHRGVLKPYELGPPDILISAEDERTLRMGRRVSQSLVGNDETRRVVQHFKWIGIAHDSSPELLVLLHQLEASH